MFTDEKLREMVCERLQWCRRKCRERGVEVPMPQVMYNSSTMVAGASNFAKFHITINLVLLQENTGDMLENTVPHEFAHLVADQLFPRARPHGYTWGTIMQEWFRVAPTRCHTYDVRNVGRGKVEKIDLDSLFNK